MKASVDDIRIMISAVITARVKVSNQEEIEKPEDDFYHDKDVPSTLVWVKTILSSANDVILFSAFFATNDRLVS